MADYNVQMKQYNGTSFDNILPYASQALTLAGGGSATEIIAQARAGLSQIATGSYVGTGTYGQSNPTVINCGFKPRMVVFGVSGVTIRENMAYSLIFGLPLYGWIEGVSDISSSQIKNAKARYSETDNGLSFWGNGALEQNNVNSTRYFWIAFG